MAITKCKECKKEVSTSAKTCPHCGVTNPGITSTQTFFGFIFIIALIAIGWYFIGGDSKDSTKPTNSTQKTTQECATNDGECLFNKYLFDAITSCKPLVERSAKYEYEWTDGMLTPAFSHYRLNAKDHQMTFIGDKVKFANGFNAKSTMIYSCTINLKTKKVIDFNIEQGKL
ncbi:hypothetical protein [Edwardsiella tarda]|uniref:hypothetical protein n=1 Tax=Edwardsiella tarda TaxID=636 RepID=UPI00098F27C4|nr:hypothetical protein [Edwardsiella tarda]